METVVLVATSIFLLTNIDKLAVLVAFCLDEDYRTREVVVGLFAGSSLGLVGAVLGSVVAVGFFQTWTPLLGVVPLGLGIWGLVRHSSRFDGEALEADPDMNVLPGPLGRLSVVTGTVAGLNGENLAVYIPFFAGLSTAELGFVIGLYLVGTGVVFLAAFLLARGSTAATEPPVWVDRWLVPVVLLLVGIYVLVTGLLLA